MKTTNATQKIKTIKTRYLVRYLLSIFAIIIFSLLILFIYLSSQYLDMFYSEFIFEKLSFLFISDNQIQVIVNVAVSILFLLIDVIIVLVLYYMINSRYQTDFYKVFFEELKLNEIYLNEKRFLSVNSSLSFAYSALDLNDMEEEYLFSLKSLVNLNFHQYYSKQRYRKKGVLISSENEISFENYVQFNFEENNLITETNDKSVIKFIYDKPSKYPYPLYIYSNLGVNSSKVLDDNIVEKIYQLRKFTRSNFIFSIHKNHLILYINNWELRITDSLRKKLTFNSIDKKIDSFTKLVDELQDLYINILKNYEVMKYGK